MLRMGPIPAYELTLLPGEGLYLVQVTPSKHFLEMALVRKVLGSPASGKLLLSYWGKQELREPFAL